jgi:hypothetical protein
VDEWCDEELKRMRSDDLETRVQELQRELAALEWRFHRSTDSVRVKTLLRMHKLTQDFLMWLISRDGEEQVKSAVDSER